MLNLAQVRNDLQMGRLPPVQPFHAMAYPFSTELALAISQKYAQFCAVTASRMRPPQLSHPAARPLARGQRLRVAYVSSDFGNHPLSHLMGSVFGLHDRSKVWRTFPFARASASFIWASSFTSLLMFCFAPSITCLHCVKLIRQAVENSSSGAKQKDT